MAKTRISLQAQAIENQFRQAMAEADGGFDLEVHRANTRDAHELTGIPEGCRVEEIKIGDVESLQMIPPDDEEAFTTIFLHGGAFCLMSAWTHHRFAGHIALACRNRVVVPDYSLAPEHPYPAALNQCVQAISEIIQDDSSSPVALIGESAGGGLALSSLLRMRDAGDQLPFAAAFMAPWLDLTLSSPSVKDAAKIDVILTETNLSAQAKLYAQDADMTDPMVSPLFGTFQGLPPLYLQASGKDLLRDDCTRLEQAYAAQGLQLKHDLYAEMIHSFQFHAGRMPEADMAISDCAEFLRAAFKEHRA